MDALKFILKYLNKYKFQYGAGILALFVVDFANVFIPKATGNITDGLTAKTMDWAGVKEGLLTIFLLGLTLAIGRFLWRFFLMGSSRKVERDIRNDLFAHLETLDVEYYNSHKTGDIMTRFTSDLNAVRLALGPAVISIFDAVVMTIMIVFQMVVYVDWKLTLLSMVPMLFICFGYLYFGNVLETMYTERQQAISNLTDFVQESFSGVRVIKAFVREKAELKAFLKRNQETMDKSLHIAKLHALLLPLLDAVIGFSGLVTLLYGGYLTLVGDITLGRFVAFYQYILMLVWPMLACAESAIMFTQGAASIRRIEEVMKATTDIVDAEDAVQVEEVRGEIDFTHLTFKHMGQEEAVLQDIDLHVPAGTTLAIIGRTGNGKSTLVNLLLRLYKTEPGMILIDGIDILKLPLKKLRESVAYVPQDNFLFSDTLKENIAFGVKEKDLNAVIKAAEAACVHDNIIAFPEGYDTVVGERGVTLSGGQKQRSSIARALMKDSPILILDDSLSAVDTDTEEHILHNLKENRRGKTTILIAHRISTVQNADVIMVLDKGKAVEVGNHETLLALNGIYAAMYEKQQLEAAIGAQEVNA